MTTDNKIINERCVIPLELAGKRLDQAVAALLPHYSRGRLQGWIKSGELTVNGTQLKPKDKVNENDEILIKAELTEQASWSPQDIDVPIIYADDDILVINKPAGLTVHPGAGTPDQTLANALLHHYPELSALPRAGVVHRLDKDTTGVMVVARTITAHTFLVNAIQEREVKREYIALVRGNVISGSTIDAPIGRHPSARVKQAVVESGKPAVTHYRVAERFEHYTLLDVQLDTGRTHQIRVHMAHIRHPIVGDHVYQGRLQIAAGVDEVTADAIRSFKRQALHAKQLTLVHPTTHESMTFSADLPDDLQQLLQTLREHDHV